MLFMVKYCGKVTYMSQINLASSPAKDPCRSFTVVQLIVFFIERIKNEQF